MAHTRILFTHSGQFRVRFGNSLVPLHDRMHGHLALSHKLHEMLARPHNLLIQRFSFRDALRMNRRRTLAFARQTFGLNNESFERGFELTANL